MPPTVHVVPHTHWDREWYHPAAVFGVRLLRLVDDLLDLLERRPDFRTFLLDGQAIVLDDYLAARPEHADRLRRLFAEGRLEAGPWYVLADEFLVSAEALVRNLLAGARTVRRLGGRPMAVGYSPDAFGHPAGFPSILAGFGLEVALLWRGLGGGPGEDGDLYRWRGPDGAEVLLVHLSPPGYENGQSLPASAPALRERWARLRAQLAPRARVPHWLVLAGADHHAAQHDLPEIVGRLAALEPGTAFAITGLEDYTAAVLRWAREEGGRRRAALPALAGDLRAGHRHAWALQGTHGSRLYLKQANAACQRLLERYAEPLAALEASRGGARRGAELAAAWRSLLENHPHDSICGTSADAVHREMVVRFERCLAQGREIVARGLDGAAGHDAVAAREAGRAAWKPGVLLFNPAPVRRDAVVEADVALFKSDVSVGQQRVAPASPVRPGRFRLLDARGAAVRFQVLGERDGHDLVESPLRYPLSSAVKWRRVAVAARDLPPRGVAALAVDEGRAAAFPAAAGDVVVEAAALRNARLEVRVEPAGTIALRDLDSGAVHRGLAELWDNGDAGDSYTYAQPRRDRVVREPDAVAVRVLHAGPLRGTLEIARRYDATALEAVTRVTLDAGADAVAIEVRGENRRPDHRLRLAFPLGEKPLREVADGHYGPVERVPGPPPRQPPGIERAAPTAPMQRCVTAAGAARALTVMSDGLPEYELRADGVLLVTLLRAFGQLSRADMPERPGHAGWPTPTPEAQCLGPFTARLAVRPHPAGALDARGDIERAAEAFHAPPLAAMRRSLLALPAAVAGPSLQGEGLVFAAFKPAESGPAVVLRCYNALARAVAGAWRVPWPVRDARLARLDETPLGPLDVGRDGEVRFTAAPRAVVTVLLR